VAYDSLANPKTKNKSMLRLLLPMLQKVPIAHHKMTC